MPEPGHLVMPGDIQVSKGKYSFRCPACGGEYSYDESIEPMCTGPSWTDDHMPEMMIRTSSPRKLVLAHHSRRTENDHPDHPD